MLKSRPRLQKHLSRLLSFALGFIPLIAGCIIDWCSNARPDIAPPYFLFSGPLLLLWVLLAFLFRSRSSSAFRGEVVWLLNLPALFFLIMDLVQELYLHGYWQNVLGKLVTALFLPLLHIGFNLPAPGHTVFEAYCWSFALLLAASGLGCWMSERYKVHTKKRSSNGQGS